MVTIVIEWAKSQRPPAAYKGRVKSSVMQSSSELMIGADVASCILCASHTQLDATK